MRINNMRKSTLAAGLFVSTFLVAQTAAAGPVYQPPGANLTYGDVTHGLRVQSASSNPAAAAADHARGEGQSTRGTVISVAAGLEYGNVQELFDLYDAVAGGYKPSTPAPPGPGGNPDYGIDVGEIIDELFPDAREAIDAIADELATQGAVLALLSTEGYGKAWVSADAPFVVGNGFLGGTWTAGVNWSGASKAFGAAQDINFDVDEALMNLEDWINDNLGGPLTGGVNVSDDVSLRLDPASGNTIIVLDNDSSLLTKATQLTELNVGYSRQSLSTDAGNLFLGLEAKFYDMRLSRASVRFGDVTSSKDLFDIIDNSTFNNEQDIGVDVGALWVGRNYQIGVQWTNINEPEFKYPELDLSGYRTQTAIDFLNKDRLYKMDSQVKIETSLFSSDRRWSAHLGYDADPAMDPLGDEFQWVTLSASLNRDSFWLPNLRVGYRENLAGTELGYASIGLTAFKFVNFDIASALDTVKIDGTELPQGLMFSLGFQIAW